MSDSGSSKKLITSEKAEKGGIPEPSEVVSDTLRQMIDVDRLVHDPVRYALLAYLHVVTRADFTFLLNQLGVSRGNLSSHMAKLEAAGYVLVEKTFVDNRPNTTYALTDAGRTAFRTYRAQMLQAMDVPKESSS